MSIPGTWQGLPIRYISTYTIAFNANGGKGKMAKQTLKSNQTAKLRKNTFTRKGYLFVGWAKSKNGAVAYKNAQKVKDLVPTGSTRTLYAKWAKKNYKVKFYANGGTGKMAVEKFTYGKSKKLLANKFKRKSHTFKGWAISKANAEKGIVKYKNKQIVKNLLMNGKTVKLYAVWKAAASAKSGSSVSLSEALDAKSLKFSIGGDSSWYAVADSSRGVVVRSGAMKDRQSSWVQTTVNGPGTISFYWKIQGAFPNDSWIRFHVVEDSDIGILKWGDDRGIDTWARVSIDIPYEGIHTLRWSFCLTPYTHNFTSPSNSRYGMIDQVTWNPW